MVLIRQDTKSLLIFPPKILDVFESVPVAKNLSNIIRATYLIEQAVTRYDFKGLLIRIQLRNCLHDKELHLCYTSLFIICKKELKSPDELSLQ